MTGNAVSALRGKRGLRPVMRVVEAPVVPPPQTIMMTERTDTMKTYLLRGTKTVEAQSGWRVARGRTLTPAQWLPKPASSWFPENSLSLRDQRSHPMGEGDVFFGHLTPGGAL